MPKVSVIVPVRNEVKFIERCLRSLIDQDFPKDQYEIIVVDGNSTDGTKEILKRFERIPNLKILNNPKGLTPYALNIGLSHAKGEFIARVDGHAYVGRDYLKKGVEFLEEHPDVDVVGGPLIHDTDGWKGKAIAEAMSSIFGCGGAVFRCGMREGFVDTVAFGIYRRSVFERIGNFREDLPKNQDDEFHLRLRMNGGKIYLTRSIRVYYTPRKSYGALFRQYFGYGFFRPKVIKMHRRIAAFRHLVPPIFVVTMAILSFSAIFSQLGRFLFLSILGLYLFSSLAFGLYQSMKRKSVFLSLLLLPAYWSMHFGYGLGFIKGLLKRGRG
jgi:glycosyltransferase involved in cell wall biosynthesis